MIVNQANLSNLYTGLSAAFNAAFMGTPVWWERLAMLVPVDTRTIDYKFLLNFPMVREWIGDRQIRNLEAYKYQLDSKDYEATIEIERNDLEDDQVGLYNPLVQELGRAAKKHPDILLAALIAAGGATACYDGQYFFDTDHPVGTGTDSNFDSGASTAWYLFDTTREIKPFIYQLRKSPELVRQDRADDEHAFMRKKYRYGVDYRGAVGYGLWQLGYKSTQDLTDTYYASARAAMMSFKDADDAPLGVMPNVLVVPPSLETKARLILNADIVLGDGTAGGSKTNIWKGTAELLVLPELA